MLYTIKPGDTIPDLARRFNVPEETIAEAAKVPEGSTLQAGLLIRITDELQLQSSAPSETPDPSDTTQLESTVARAQAAQTTGLWSESYDVPGLRWNDDLQVPDYGSVYQPSAVQAGGSEEPKKSWWDKLIDKAEAKVDDMAKKVENATGNNPLVKLFTGFGRFQVQVAGGALKAVGDMVGGLVHAVTHPIQTLKGLWGLAAHIPFTPPNLIHVGIQAAQGKSFSEILDEEKRYMTGVWNGLTAGYQTAIKEGKWGEIPGRLLVDVGSLLIGAGEANAAAKGVSGAAKATTGVEVAARAAQTAEVAANASRVQKALNAATTAIKGSRVASVATRAAVVAERVIDLLSDVGRAAMTAARNNRLGAAAIAQAEQLGAKAVAIAERAKALQGVEKAGEIYAKLADEALVAAREARALGATVKDASFAQIAVELETRAGQMRLAATAGATGIPLNGLDGGISAIGDR